jgi:thioredoxin reductase (NADPH)
MVTKIQAIPNIAVRLRAEVVDGDGDGRLERLTVRDRDLSETLDAAALFVLIGAEPRTSWCKTPLPGTGRATC